MKLHYYDDGSGNFGDDLNPWLWPRLLPGLFDGRPDVLFVGIGTILNDRIPPGPQKIVFGSGTGYGPPPRPDASWRFYCVRGPRTAERLSLPPALAVTDPAALVAALVPPPTRRRGVGFMPHHRSAQHFDWRALCRSLGLVYLDPTRPVEPTLAELGRMECVIADAMHGAIVADALRVPWIPVRLYEHINEFKWLDWCDSLALTYAPVDIEPIRDNSSQRPLRRLSGYVKRVRRTGSPIRIGKSPEITPSTADAVERVAEQLAALRRNHSTATLSADGVFAARVAELQARLAEFHADARAGSFRSAPAFTHRVPDSKESVT